MTFYSSKIILFDVVESLICA